MNAAFVHLALNHVPVLGSVFGLVLLAVAVTRRNETLLRAAWVTFVFVALVAIPVYLAGEGAEEIVERQPGVSHAAIETHEQTALVALIAVEALGLLAAMALVVSRRRAVPAWLGTASLVLALLVVRIVGVTAERGGRIRHSEAYGAASPDER
jgi:fucose 4-O-acetylase-like acetyltransferase